MLCSLGCCLETLSADICQKKLLRTFLYMYAQLKFANCISALRKKLQSLQIAADMLQECCYQIILVHGLNI